jgi:hypothetical protein
MLSVWLETYLAKSHGAIFREKMNLVKCEKNAF